MHRESEGEAKGNQAPGRQGSVPAYSAYSKLFPKQIWMDKPTTLFAQMTDRQFFWCPSTPPNPELEVTTLGHSTG